MGRGHVAGDPGELFVGKQFVSERSVKGVSATRGPKVRTGW